MFLNSKIALSAEEPHRCMMTGEETVVISMQKNTVKLRPSAQQELEKYLRDPRVS